MSAFRRSRSAGSFSGAAPILACAATGAAFLALEVLGARLLAPRFGNTLPVWAALLSAALLSLSAGAACGGWAADRRPRGSTLAGIVSAAAVLVAAIPWMRTPVLKAAAPLGTSWGAAAASIALLGPAMTALGAVPTAAARLMASSAEGAGRAAGLAAAASTAGGLAGAVAAGFWLVPALRVSAILWLIAAFLAGAAAALHLGSAREPGT